MRFLELGEVQFDGFAVDFGEERFDSGCVFGVEEVDLVSEGLLVQRRGEVVCSPGHGGGGCKGCGGARWPREGSQRMGEEGAELRPHYLVGGQMCRSMEVFGDER